MRIAGIALVAGLVGCASPPAEAPAELTNLAEFLFLHAGDEDTAELAAGVAQLRTLNESEDFTMSARDRAVQLDILDGENLGELSIPSGVKAADQVPIGLARQSSASYEGNVNVALEVNRVCIESDTTVWAQRTFSEGEDCYGLDGCDTLRFEQPTRKENPLAKIWYDLKGFYRLVDVEPAEGEPFQAIVYKYWIDEVGQGDGGNNTWDQLFGIDITYEEADGSVGGWVGLWSSVDIFPLGADSYGNLVIDGLEQGGVFADEFIAGTTDGKCPLDRDAPMPERK
ncbi:MAG: hypothetical protein AAGA48_08040 [Myxococcota bacterium]